MKLFNPLYLPISCVLIYFNITILLFQFGPINYEVKSPLLFYTLLYSYQLSLLIGYLFSIQQIRLSAKSKKSTLFLKFWPFAMIALFAGLAENMAMTKGGIIPTNVISFYTSGISFEEIGQNYYNSKINGANFGGNKLFNIASILFAWARLMFISYVIFFWFDLALTKKLFSLFVITLLPIAGITLGLNKPLMEFSLVVVFTAILRYYFAKVDKNIKYLKGYRRFTIFGGGLVVIGVVFFIMTMASRGADFTYLVSTSPTGMIEVNCDVCESDKSGILVGLVWFINYVCQGYFGFGLALEESFDSTYGFGSSPFLLRQAEWLFGIDMRPSTFQFKTDPEWGESNRWHSIYTHFANDFGFISVNLHMLLIGALSGYFWKLAYVKRLDVAIQVLPMLGIMFIYFPANNQIFGFLPGLSTIMIAVAISIKFLLRRERQLGH